MNRNYLRIGTFVVLLAAATVAGLELANRRGHLTPEHIRLEGVTRRIDRLQVPFVRDGVIYGFEDHSLYVSRDTGASFVRMGSLPKPAGAPLLEQARDVLARSALVRRFRRYDGPRSLVVLESGTVVVLYDRIYRSEDGGKTFEIVEGTEILPGRFPSSVGVAVGPGDTIFYGEYTTAPRPHEVRVVRGTDDGRSWSVARTFAAGELFHIHSIAYDRFRNRYWVASGDMADEIRLMYSEDGFTTIETAGCCEQSWRIVDLVLSAEGLYWGSDDDQEQPALYFFDPETGVLETLEPIENPSYHATLLENGWMAVSTTFEPRSAYSKARLPPKRTAVYLSPNGRDWTMTLRLEGDSAAMRLGLRPQIQFPSGDPVPALFASPRFTAEQEFSLLYLDIPTNLAGSGPLDLTGAD